MCIFGTYFFGMMRVFFLVIISLAFSINALGQRRLLTQGTAFPLGRQDIHLAIFHPSIYGFSDKFELSSTLPALPIYPKLTPKLIWWKKEQWALATEHSVWMPTSLFRILPSLPRFESYPAADLIPSTLGFNTRLLFSYAWGETDCSSFTSQEFNRNNTFKGNTDILTLQIGAQSGWVMDSIPFPIIEEGLVYQRTAFLNEDISWFAGLGWDGRLRTSIDFSLDLNYIALPASAWAIEQKSSIQLYWWKFFHIQLGYHASLVNTGSQNIFFAGPVIDFQWTLRKDKIQYGLFGKKMF